MTRYECMICGSRKHVLREGQIFLCARCIAALGEALAEKLTKKEEETKCISIMKTDTKSLKH